LATFSAPCQRFVTEINGKGIPAHVPPQRRFRLPMTLAATPVSTAAEQQQDDDDNQEQFHGTPPLMVWRHRWPAGSPFNWSSNARKTNFMTPDKTQRLRGEIVPTLSTWSCTPRSVIIKITRKKGKPPLGFMPNCLSSVQFYTDVATARAQSHTCRTLRRCLQTRAPVCAYKTPPFAHGGAFRLIDGGRI
jgi:hypothetical protein